MNDISYFGDAKSPRLIATLESWLASARRGDLNGLAAVVAINGEGTEWIYSQWNTAEALGYLRYLEFRLAQRWAEGYA